MDKEGQREWTEKDEENRQMRIAKQCFSSFNLQYCNSVPSHHT